MLKMLMQNYYQGGHESIVSNAPTTKSSCQERER